MIIHYSNKKPSIQIRGKYSLAGLIIFGRVILTLFVFSLISPIYSQDFKMDKVNVYDPQPVSGKPNHYNLVFYIRIHDCPGDLYSALSRDTILQAFHSQDLMKQYKTDEDYIEVQITLKDYKSDNWESLKKLSREFIPEIESKMKQRINELWKKVLIAREKRKKNG